ncbi:MAG: P1 family peptidase [Actinomycetales bacterium]
MTPAAVVPGPCDDLTDVPGVAVGHHDRRGDGWLTGTTVVLPPVGTVAGVDVRGGGPASRETDALSPTTLVEHADAVVLTGGSAYGLAAADGVMAWLEERGRGFRVGPEPGHVVPIVPAAALFDLGRGGDFRARPTTEFGRQAAAAATDGPVAQGSVGAGTGAVAGGLAGGVGSASTVLPSGVTVAALVAVNSAGSVVDPVDGTLRGVRAGLPGEFDSVSPPSPADVAAWGETVARAASRVPPFNTTLAVVATDARLTPAQCSRLATAAHDGMARAIDPVHTYLDGDIAFALATGTAALADPALPALNALLGVAGRVVSRAIAHAVLAATGAEGAPSYRDAFPSACR